MEIFVRIDGLTGPVTSPEARKASFRATSFDWGGIQTTADAVGDGTRHRPLVLKRSIDGASSAFYESVVALAPVATKRGVVLAADVVDSKGALSPCATYQMRGAFVTGLVLSAMNGGADTVTEEVGLRYTDIAVQHDPSGQKFTDTFL